MQMAGIDSTRKARANLRSKLMLKAGTSQGTAQRHTEDERVENGADGGAGGAEAQIQQAHPGDLIGEARDAREEEKTYREDDDMSLV